MTSDQFMLLKCPNILIAFNTELYEQEQTYSVALVRYLNEITPFEEVI